ncbi:hypothetical protein RRF57_009588 [Xylaria bambusicola]|uniref:Uncharacterized protein n=1 Tax=Xylaria bambusicola TaxID=326684 RepID=A0AAN7V2S5_9PEZI
MSSSTARRRLLGPCGGAGIRLRIFKRWSRFPLLFPPPFALCGRGRRRILIGGKGVWPMGGVGKVDGGCSRGCADMGGGVLNID